MGDKRNIVIIGDSFVQGVGDEENDGWTGIFRREFEKRYNIFIKGYGGNNIYDVLARIEKDLLPFHPSIVILQVGINDSRLRKSLGFSNEIKEGKFRKGLEEFVNRIKQSLKMAPNFIFIGTTPVVDKLTTPYKKDKIGAPETKLVKGGRLNRLGVSFLYLATNIETAINEVRPDPGHKVSIGKFKSVKDLRIVDFDKAFINMSDTEKSLNDFQLLNHIDQLFSRPITQDERHKYIITQFFSDIFRKLGFDGVMFTSSVGSGKNLLIFNPKNFIYVGSKENKVYDILKLRYFSKAF